MVEISAITPNMNSLNSLTKWPQLANSFLKIQTYVLFTGRTFKIQNKGMEGDIPSECCADIGKIMELNAILGKLQSFSIKMDQSSW